MDLPSVSVIIPSYNHTRFISEAIYSALNQSHPPCEVIVIDDGSEDSSAVLIRQIAVVRPEIKFHHHQNRGAHNTINAGMALADGDLLAILNSDDVYEPWRLGQAARRFAADPTLDVVTTRVRFIDGEGRETKYPWYDDARAFYESSGRLDASLINANFFMTTSNIVARRSLFTRIAPFSDLRYTHDLDFFLRVLASGGRIVELPECGLRYRLHGSNTISEGELKVKAEWAATVAAYLVALWERKGVDWSAAGLILDTLKRHGLTEAVLLLVARLSNTGPSPLQHFTLADEPSLKAAVDGTFR